MNRYQKVLVCIFRSFGILGLGYLLISVGTAAIMMPGMLRASGLMMLPVIIPSLLLVFAAVPLAKFVTIGITEE